MGKGYEAGEVTAVFLCSDGSQVRPFHIHESYEIFMAQSKDIKFFINDRIYHPEEGDVMLLTDQDMHFSSTPSQWDYRRVIVTFSPHRLLESGGGALLECFEAVRAGGSHRLQLTPEEQREFCAIAEAIGREGEQPEVPGLGQWLELSRMLLLLTRVRRRGEPALPSGRRSLHPQVRLVQEHIDGHFCEALNLDQLSALCFLNKHYLCRLFRKETGFCIHDYITYRRLAFGIRLLREGCSVGEAALQSGFRSDSFFITTFKKNLGVTPYRFLRQNGERGLVEMRGKQG